MKTSQGTIELELFDADAPKTIANFTKLAARLLRRPDLPRVISGFMLQGGCRRAPAPAAGYTFEDEINDHLIVRGALAMANAGRTPTLQFSSSLPRNAVA